MLAIKHKVMGVPTFPHRGDDDGYCLCAAMDVRLGIQYTPKVVAVAMVWPDG